jgi:hypothetical protein
MYLDPPTNHQNLLIACTHGQVVVGGSKDIIKSMPLVDTNFLTVRSELLPMAVRVLTRGIPISKVRLKALPTGTSRMLIAHVSAWGNR